jgi:hypothetical protein
VNECFNVGAFEVKFDVSAIRGARPHMEDRWAVARHPDEDEPYVLFAVFDGHGGDAVSSFLAKRFSETLFDTNLRNLLRDDPQEALRRACRVCDEEIVSLFPKPNGFRSGPGPGSTAVVALYCLTETNPSAYVACVGDSRCVAADEHGCVVFETVDQRPSRVEERARVEALGGTVRVVGGVARSRRRARRQPRVWQRRHQGVRQSRARGFIARAGASFKRVKGRGGKRNTPLSRRAHKKAARGAHRDFVLGRTHRRRGVRPRRRGDVRAIAGAGAARRRWRERHELERVHADPRGDARGDARAAFGAAAFVLGAVPGDARDAGRERGDPRGSRDARGRGRLVGLAPRRRRADVAGQDAPERRQRVRLSVPRAPEGDEPLPAGAGGAGGGSGDAENHAGEDSG